MTRASNPVRAFMNPAPDSLRVTQASVSVLHPAAGGGASTVEGSPRGRAPEEERLFGAPPTGLSSGSPRTAPAREPASARPLRTIEEPDLTRRKPGRKTIRRR